MQWPGLSPTGAAHVDQTGVAHTGGFRTNPKPFGDAWPKPLDKHVGRVEKIEDRSLLTFEVERNGSLTSREESVVDTARSHQTDNVSPHVREQHRAKRRWADTAGFEDPDPVESSPNAARFERLLERLFERHGCAH